MLLLVLREAWIEIDEFGFLDFPNDAKELRNASAKRSEDTHKLLHDTKV